MSEIKIILFSDLSEKEVSELRISAGYFVEIDYHPMESFPIINTITGKPFVCVNRELLVKVWRSIEIRKSKMVKFQFLIEKNDKGGYKAGDLNAERLHITTQEEFDQAKSGLFEWSPGFIGAGISVEEFNHRTDEALT